MQNKKNNFNKISHDQSPKEESIYCNVALPLPSVLERPPVVHLIIRKNEKESNSIQ